MEISNRIVLICGSRTWQDVDKIQQVLSERLLPGDVIIHGCAKGADSIAEGVSRRMGLEIKGFAVSSHEWRVYGKSAGIRRNEKMLRELIRNREVGAAVLVIAFHKGSSRGTAHMIRIARMANIPTVVVRP